MVKPLLLGSRSSNAITSRTKQKRSASFKLWEIHTSREGKDIFLQNISSKEKIEVFKTFCFEYRNRRLGQMSGPPIHSCTIRNTISQVSSTFQQEGFGNPTISPSGKLNFEISQLLKAYEKQDPPRNCQPSLPLIYFETIIDI